MNQNYTDLVNGLSDGTKDLTINALTLAGTLTANGNIVLGSDSSDTITCNGRFAADLDPSATDVRSFGSTTLAWKDITLNNGATDGGAIYFDASATSFIKANAAGTALGYGAITNGIQAWVLYDQTGATSIAASYNVTSVTDSATGVFLVNLTTAFADALYCRAGVTNDGMLGVTETSTTTTVIRCIVRDNAGSAQDATRNAVMAVGAR